jgi:ABC-type branched-subunit amino acid transport system ATPase component
MHVHHRSNLASVLFRTPFMRREASEMRAAAERVLDDFGLAGDAEADATGLPFGKLRFLELARAAVMRPSMLLLDEPAAGLNQVETERLATIIRSLAGEGVGLLLVDHDVPFVFGLSDQVTVMNFGSVIASGASDDVYRDAAVREAYLGAQEVEPP